MEVTPDRLLSKSNIHHESILRQKRLHAPYKTGTVKGPGILKLYSHTHHPRIRCLKMRLYRQWASVKKCRYKLRLKNPCFEVRTGDRVILEDVG